MLVANPTLVGSADVSGGASTLTDDSSTFAFGGAAPDSHLLATGEGVFETRHAHVARETDLLGLIGHLVGLGEEHGRVEPPTCPEHPPHDFPHGSPLANPPLGATLEAACADVKRATENVA